MKSIVYPPLAEAKRYAKEYRSVPVSRTVLSDSRTPVEVLRALKAVSRHCFILESLEDTARWGRYTFLGYDPKLKFTCLDGAVRIRSGTTVTIPNADPAEYIRQIIAENKSPRLPGLPPFTGGLMGYFAYDFIKYAEPALDLEAADEKRGRRDPAGQRLRHRRGFRLVAGGRHRKTFPAGGRLDPGKHLPGGPHPPSEAGGYLFRRGDGRTQGPKQNTRSRPGRERFVKEE